MKSTTFTFKDHDGVEIFVYKWAPEGKAKAVLQIAHGMQEYAGRYARPAEVFTKAGYIVYANDERGHGKTAPSVDKQGFIGPGGWQSVLKDLRQLTAIIKQENPGLPVFLLGHSWGSFMTQAYIQEAGGDLKGAILCGTDGKNPMVGIGVIIAKVIIKLKGADTQAKMLAKLAIEALNKPFKPGRTDKDWLSRDEAEVDKYIKDPYCGAPFPNSFFLEMILVQKNDWKKENEKKVPVTLPIFFIAGSDDPVGHQTKGIQALITRYQKNSVKDVTSKFYPGARHELFNETNREEVYQDVVAWLDAHI